MFFFFFHVTAKCEDIWKEITDMHVTHFAMSISPSFPHLENEISRCFRVTSPVSKMVTARTLSRLLHFSVIVL